MSLCSILGHLWSQWCLIGDGSGRMYRTCQRCSESEVQ